MQIGKKSQLRSWFNKYVLVAAVAATSMGVGANDTAQVNLDELAKNLRPRYVVGDIMPRYNLADRMAEYGVAGVAIGVIKDGKLIETKGFGLLQAGGTDKVDANTLFSVGSVSKVATASILMKMHAEGALDVDENIEKYLKTWQLPKGEARDGADVSLRMILSHTAGFNIHGFGDFQPGAELPTVYNTLNGTAPASHEPLTFLFKPGVRYKYSGGGYTLAQLIATDVAGSNFPNVAKEKLFKPLGMNRSSFANPLPETVTNVAKAHNRNGEPAALPRGYEAMPEMAASGLWTSANELGSMVAALIESYRSKDGFLPNNIAVDMMTKVSPSEHGLGPRLHGRADNRYFHHGGANNSYRAWIEGHLATGDGLVVLTNGTRGNDLFVEIRNAAADVYGWEINKAVHTPEISIPTAMLASYEGEYKPDNNFSTALREGIIGWLFDRALTVSEKDGVLYLAGRDEQYQYALVPTSPNSFHVPVLNQRIGLAELVFHRNNKTETQSMTLEIKGALSFYNKTVSDAVE